MAKYSWFEGEKEASRERDHHPNRTCVKPARQKEDGLWDVPGRVCGTCKCPGADSRYTWKPEGKRKGPMSPPLESLTAITCCVTLDQLLYLSESQFPFL
jgi:hypothetical protein